MSNGKIGQILLFLCYLSIAFGVLPRICAGVEQPRFKRLTADDGLSQNAVFAILQDRRGFMWFGTKDGLNRYDGYRYTVYRHNPFDSTSLSANYITSLFEDSRGILWVGTFDGCLNRFIRDTEDFERICNLPIVRNGTAPYAISDITEDPGGNIWIGTTGNGLFRLSPNAAENTSLPDITHFEHIPGDVKSISNNVVNSLLADADGNIWIGTRSGLDKLSAGNDEFVFEHYSIYTKHPDAPVTHQDSSVTTIHGAQDGSLWLGTTGGIVRFNPHNGSYIFMPHRYEIYRYGWGRVTGIVEDASGYLWVGTPGELMRFDPKRQSYDYYMHDPYDPQSISHNAISRVYRDRTGILWFGTPGYGVNMFDPKASRFRVLQGESDKEARIPGFSIRSILEDNEGFLWISSDILYRWDRVTGKLKNYETTWNELNEFGNVGAWAMLQANHSGILYFATHQGLFTLDPASETVRHYEYDAADPDGLPQKEVFAVFEDRKGGIWIATRNYLSKLIDVKEEKFRHYQYTQRMIDELVRPQIYEDVKGTFWLGTDDGLLRFNPTTETFLVYRNDPMRLTSLSNNDIKSIHPDPDEPGRILWLGTTGGGLNRFDIESEQFRYFTVDDGLPNNVVYGILADETGHLWLSTNKGLSRFDRATETFKNYDINDGLQSNEFNTGAFHKSKNGEMFFGGIHGLNYFFPADIVDNPHQPEIVITGLKILNRNVSHKDSDSILKKSISETGTIHIPYLDNIITFEFSALDYSAPEKNQYAHMLEGFQREWVYTGTNRTATFTNLSPGTYTFRVRGSNNDGVWSHQEASIVLVINPPFWQSWWAYILYVVGAISVLYLFRRYEMNRIRLRNQLRVEHVKRAKMTEMDSLKTRFFANISHELRTPLTLIMGPAEQLSSELQDERLRHKSQLIYSNAQRLLRLINQLLDISRLESGSMKLHAGLYDVVPFLKGITMSFSAYAERKRIDLNFTTTEERIALYFDHDKAEKIFINLISNAIKYTPTGGSVSITVSKENSASGSCANISISDTGIGIPSDQLVFVFDRFYQVNGSGSHEQEGTGIGLALVKELVELHHGSVTVTSEMGTGSVFTVKLPLGMEHLSHDDILDRDKQILDDIPVPARESIYLEDNLIDNENGTDVQQEENEVLILIVEDNNDLRFYIKEQLKNGYKIMEAANGVEGFSAASDSIPDLIISDVMMPKMDGYEFCKKIKNDQRTSHIPVILLTARAGEKDKYTGLKTGADEYLIKPFSSEELILRVENLIESRRRLREKYSANMAMKPTDIAVTPVDKIFLEHVLSAIDAHMDDSGFSVETLANLVNMSQSQMHRKLKALTNMSTNQFIRSIRMQRALDLLKKNAGNVAEVAYMVGYEDPGYFTRTFKNHFQYLPSEVNRE
jgi:signal transduction histidine kinase/ligand-binding sensor domain-containing protein/DNA-binding response OmpR family regulator